MKAEFRYIDAPRESMATERKKSPSPSPGITTGLAFYLAMLEVEALSVPLGLTEVDH